MMKEFLEVSQNDITVGENDDNRHRNQPMMTYMGIRLLTKRTLDKYFTKLWSCLALFPGSAQVSVAVEKGQLFCLCIGRTWE